MLRAFIAMLLVTAVAGARAEAFDHWAWARLLRRFVADAPGSLSSEVDYAGLRAERPALAGYLEALAAVRRERFDRWPAEEQLAFLINAYNAWTVDLVLSGPPGLDSIKDLGSLLRSPWKRSFIPLFGRTVSLDDIEHGMIRGSGRYRDPRIHFALNCASIGCPGLRQEPYTGARLDAQLESAVQIFLRDRTRNRFEDGALKVSALFQWYGEDFAAGWRGIGSLHAFLAHHAGALGLDAATAARLARGEIRIEFLPYDWRLNRMRAAPPLSMHRSDDAAPLER
ncbi:MAG: DUF547 domain-containing protein [Gammaproteobacteria bacterium]